MMLSNVSWRALFEATKMNVLSYLLQPGADIKMLNVADIMCRNELSLETLEMLIACGWDINDRGQSWRDIWLK